MPSLQIDLQASEEKRHRRSLIPLLALSSICVLIPCFWHPHIQSTDLPSHLYNAWLSAQVIANRFPGLVIIHPPTNFLVDELFAYAIRLWNVWWAEHIVVGVSVLVFFWGIFRFISALTGRRLWQLTPLLAMISYGTVFRWGFLNFYVSLGLSLWAASFVLRRSSLHWLLAVLTLSLAVISHASAPLWIVLVVLYYCGVTRADARQRKWIFGLSVMAVFVGRLALPHLIACDWPSYSIKHIRLYAGFAGFGQIAPYGKKYWVISLLLVSLWSPYLARAARRWSFQSFLGDAVLQLFLLHVLVSILAPLSMHFPSFPPGVSLSLINDRLSLLTAVLGCALLARTKMTRLQTSLLVSIAVLFFTFAYLDEHELNKREEQVRSLVATVPVSQRMIFTVREKEVGVPQLVHLLDRPCIGRCFDFANYEPSTGQFRLRATKPNDFVMWNFGDTREVENGTYVVKKEDMPLYWIHLCEKGEAKFCAELASPGQTLRGEYLGSRSKSMP